MRCASISIGVTRYAHSFFMQHENRLKYAASDAEAFHRYAATAWDGEEDRHHILTDAAANTASVEQTFAALAKAGAFEMLLVYLSGHGERDRNALRGWFCLTDAQPGKASLDGERLQELLSGCRSERVVLIVDCCYAEAVPTGMSFFSGLVGPDPQAPPASARVYIASARFSQRAWEEDDLRRSVFSDVLLRGLSTASPVADAGGLVDLEARLIPFLREQVPLQAASHKGGMVQEPLTGGISALTIRLPTVTMKSLGRELTVAQTVRRRVVQIASVLVGGIVLAILAIDAMGYHVTVNTVGHLVVRPGLASTYGSLPFHTRSEIDTGVTLADIDPGADDFLAALSEGAIRGMITHLDVDGLRPWLVELEGHVTPPRRALSAALTRGEIVQLDGTQHPPPLQSAAFLAQLRGVPASSLRDQLYAFEWDGEVDCAKAGGAQINDLVLGPAPSVFRAFAIWWVGTAPRDPTARVPITLSLLRSSAHRAFHAEDDAERLVELRTLGAALRQFPQSHATQLADVGVSSAENQLDQILSWDRGSWCHPYALLARGLLTGSSEQRREVEGAFVAEIARAYGDDRAAPTLDQAGEWSAVAIHDLAMARPLDEMTTRALGDLARAHDLRQPTPGPAFEVLSAVMPLQRVPVELTDALLARMEAPPIEEFDSLPVDCFLLLASGAAFLDAGAVQRLRDWASSHLSDMYTMSGYHAGLGFLSLASAPDDKPSLAQAQIDLLLSNLSPASRFAPDAVSYSGTTVITASGDEAVIALGRVLRSGHDLSADTVEQLANVAQARHDLPERSELIKGLAVHWYGLVDPADIAAVITGRISRVRDRATRRALEAEVAGTYLRSVPAPEREGTRGALLDQWKNETEPDAREALALVIALAGTNGQDIAFRPFTFETGPTCAQTCN